MKNYSMNHINVAILFGTLAFTAPNAICQDAAGDKEKKIDKIKQAYLDSEGITNEQEFDAVYGNGDGEVTDAEIELFKKDAVLGKIGRAYAEKDDVESVDDFDLKYGDGNSEVTDAEIEAFLESNDKESFNILGLPIFVRDSFEEYSYNDQLKSTFDGATFSYARDKNAGNDEWLAKGAVFTATALKIDSNAYNARLVGGIDFDRFTGTADKDDEVNKLTLRTGLDIEIPGNNQLPTWYLRPSAAYTTDFDWDTGILSLRMDLEPYYNPGGESYFALFDTIKLGKGIPVKYLLRTTLRTDVGYVFDPGKSTLIDDDWYVWVGPKLSLKLIPDTDNDLIDNLSLSFDYTYLTALTGSPEKSDNFVAKAKYKITSEISAEIAYETGEVAIVNQDVERLTIGFALKF